MKDRIIDNIKKHPLLLLVNLFGLYLFAKMAEDVIDKEFILIVDKWISNHIHAIQKPLLTEWIITLTNFNGNLGILAFSAVFIVLLIYHKCYQDLWFYLLSVGGAAILFSMIKLIVGRLRPNPELIEVAGYAFPSGHTTMATAMSVALYFILVKKLHNRILIFIVLIAAITWPLMIAGSRIYLNVHWISDVIAGLGLGLFWVTLIKLIFKNG